MTTSIHSDNPALLNKGAQQKVDAFERSIREQEDVIRRFDAYIDDVISGRILASKKVIAACKRHLRDMDKAANDPDYPWCFDAALAARPVRFMEKYTLMDGEKDANQRPLLQPNPALATGNLVNGRPMDYVDDADMPNVAGGAPVVVGYLKAFATLFDRGAMELASTPVGGGAWENYTIDTRAIIRQDYQIMDPTAAVMLALATE